MAVSKKKVKQVEKPKGNHIGQGGNPEQYYVKHPAWNFSSCDKEKWSIFSERTKQIFWEEIFPYFQNMETSTWNDILVTAKKKNHSIEVKSLNKVAADRLAELFIEAEALISLRISATHRIYGYMNDAVFNVVWVDLEHGDNADCVCRSKKKHT